MGESTSDPRGLHGDMSGPDGSVVLDTRRAVLLDHTNVCRVDDYGGPEEMWAMLLSGRINKSQDRAQVLFLFGIDGAAAIITELLMLAERAGGAEELVSRMSGRLGKAGAGSSAGMKSKEEREDER